MTEYSGLVMKPEYFFTGRQASSALQTLQRMSTAVWRCSCVLMFCNVTIC